MPLNYSNSWQQQQQQQAAGLGLTWFEFPLVRAGQQCLVNKLYKNLFFGQYLTVDAKRDQLYQQQQQQK